MNRNGKLATFDLVVCKCHLPILRALPPAPPALEAVHVLGWNQEGYFQGVEMSPPLPSPCAFKSVIQDYDSG